MTKQEKAALQRERQEVLTILRCLWAATNRGANMDASEAYPAARLIDRMTAQVEARA